MPIIGTFGKLSGTVTPIKGDPYNELWVAPAVIPNVTTLVFTHTVPGSPSLKKLYIQGISLASRINCTIELLRNSVLVWEGGTGFLNTDLPPTSFGDGEIVGDPADVFEVRILHKYVSPLRFAGSVFGYTR